jgi:CRP-like cAMP-binding protein
VNEVKYGTNTLFKFDNTSFPIIAIMSKSPIENLRNALSDQNIWDKTIDLERNAYLNVKGNTNRNIYLVNNGSLRIFIDDGLEEHTTRFAYVNDVFAVLDSYFSNQPSQLFIQALKKCTLQVISKGKFDAFIKSDINHANDWQKVLEFLIIQQIERETDLLTSSPGERYRRVLNRSPRLFQEIPHKYIAAYLRMSPETLSRLKKS